MATVHSDVDHVLTTTRSVRLRMTLDRPVSRELIDECLEVALQAPSGGNVQDWGFVVVDDRKAIEGLGELYEKAFHDRYGTLDAPSEAGLGLTPAVRRSAQYLADRMRQVPMLVVPYRRATAPTRRQDQASFWAGILPAAWSLMLAARSRGLVSTYTTRGLDSEEEIAGILGLPYPEVTQAGLIAFGHPDRQEFKRARRVPLDSVRHFGRADG